MHMCRLKLVCKRLSYINFHNFCPKVRYAKVGARFAKIKKPMKPDFTKKKKKIKSSKILSFCHLFYHLSLFCYTESKQIWMGMKWKVQQKKEKKRMKENEDKFLLWERLGFFIFRYLFGCFSSSFSPCCFLIIWAKEDIIYICH